MIPSLTTYGFATLLPWCYLSWEPSTIWTVSPSGWPMTTREATCTPPGASALANCPIAIS